MEITKHYNETVTLEFDPQAHVYLIDGKKANGVTTVLNRLAKPGLLYWAAKMASEHVESILKPGVGLDEVQIKQLAKDAIWAHRNVKDKAADMGTWVHQWIQDFIKGDNPEKPHNPELYKSTAEFIDWYKTLHHTNPKTEVKLCSPTLMLAGTADLITEVEGELTIIDWKTGKGIYPEAVLQMGAYSLMYEEEFGKEVKRVGVVNCSIKAPFKTYFTDEVKRAKDIYLLLLNLDREFHKLEQEMKGV